MYKFMMLKKGQKYLIYILAVFLIIVPSVSAIDTLPSSVEIPSIKLPTVQSKMSVQPSVISNAPALPVAPYLTVQKPSIVTAPVNPIFSDSSSPNMADLNIVNDTFDSVSEPPVGWKFRGNLANTGEYDDGGIRPNGKLKWKTDLDQWGTISPAIYEDIIYFGGDDIGNSYMTALDLNSGKFLWNFEGSGYLTNCPAIFDGIIYFGNNYGNNKFYALDAKSGKKLWEYAVGSYITSSPTISNGYVFFGTLDQKIFCLNAKNGNLRWIYNARAPVRSCPAISNKTIYFSSSSTLYALNLVNGQELWKYDTGDSIYGSTPAVDSGMVFFATTSKFHALNASTGERIWEINIGGSDPAVSDGIVFFSHNPGNWEASSVYAVSALTGNKIWEFKTGGKTTSSPAVSNGAVYFGSTDRILYALNAKTGKQLWIYLSEGMIEDNPVIRNGVIYFGNSNTGKVYAIGTGKPDNGTLSITSSPSKASIYIDESNTGKKTPATVSGLTVGEHQVLLKKTGYSDFNQTVNLTLGKTTKLKAKLNRICTLVINSKPSGASVWIDNSSTEKVTPYTNSTLAPGTHEVKLEKEGYKAFYKKVVLKSGKKVTLNTKLTPN